MPTSYFTKIIGTISGNNLQTAKLEKKRHPEEISPCNLDDIYIRKADHGICSSEMQPARISASARKSSTIQRNSIKTNSNDAKVISNDDQMGWGIQEGINDDKSIVGRFKTNSFCESKAEQRNIRLLSAVSAEQINTDLKKDDKQPSRLRLISIASDYIHKCLPKFSSLEECNDGWETFEENDEYTLNVFLLKNEAYSIQTASFSDALQSSVQSVTVSNSELYSDDCNTVSDISDYNTIPLTKSCGAAKEFAPPARPSTLKHLGIETENLADAVEVRPSRGSFHSLPPNISKADHIDSHNMKTPCDDNKCSNDEAQAESAAKVSMLRSNKKVIHSFSSKTLEAETPQTKLVADVRSSQGAHGKLLEKSIAAKDVNSIEYDTERSSRKSMLPSFLWKSSKPDTNVSRSDATFDDTVCISFGDIFNDEEAKEAAPARMRASTLTRVLADLESSLQIMCSSLEDIKRRNAIDSSVAIDSLSSSLSRMKSTINQAFNMGTQKNQSEKVDLSDDYYNILHEPCFDNAAIRKKPVQDPTSINTFLDTDKNGKFKGRSYQPNSRQLKLPQRSNASSSSRPTSRKKCRSNFNENPLHSSNTTPRKKIQPLHLHYHTSKLHEDSNEPLLNSKLPASQKQFQISNFDTKSIRSRVSRYFDFITKPTKATV